MIKWLLISALGCLFALSAHYPIQQSCEPLSVEVTTEMAANPSAGWKILLTYGAGVRQNDIVLHLYPVSGGKKKRITGTEIAGLEPGKYLLVVVDESLRYCFKKFEIEITP